MKKAIRVSFILIITVFRLQAQTGNYGVYKTWQDYKAGTLFCSINPDSSKGSIKLHDVLAGNYIDIIKDGKKYRFNKDSIFGYRDKDKNDYRFYKSNDREYRILESKTITIYLADVSVASSNGKNRKLTPTYFFSTTPGSEIVPLTILNLKRAFPGNLKFHDMLDVEFGNGEAPSAYSGKDNMYVVNLLLAKSTLQ